MAHLHAVEATSGALSPNTYLASIAVWLKIALVHCFGRHPKFKAARAFKAYISDIVCARNDLRQAHARAATRAHHARKRSGRSRFLCLMDFGHNVLTPNTNANVDKSNRANMRCLQKRKAAAPTDKTDGSTMSQSDPSVRERFEPTMSVNLVLGLLTTYRSIS